MARAFPLQAARDLADRRLDDAAMALRGFANRLSAAETKLTELEGFRREYSDQRSAELVAGIAASKLRGFDAFLGRLEQAIDAQRVDCSRQRAMWEAAREAWIAAYRKAEAMSALAKRHAASELAREAMGERKRDDEFSVRVAAIKAQENG